MNGPADLARGWVLKADSDLGTARQLVAGPGPYDTACFHAQQAIEKCLKAVIGYFGAPVPHIHDLEKLAHEARAVAPGLDVEMEKLAHITPFAVEPRYKLEFWPEREVAEEAVETAENVRDRVLKVLPPEARP